MAGDDKAVARVVPLAAADRHRAGDAQPAEHVGHAPAGVFHQHQPGEPYSCWASWSTRRDCSRVKATGNHGSTLVLRVCGRCELVLLI